MSLPHSPLDDEAKRRVVEVRASETPMGMRTLSRHRRYRAHFTGDMMSRDDAYHNGTVWLWLIGPMAEAVLRAGGFDDESKRKARGDDPAADRNDDERVPGADLRGERRGRAAPGAGVHRAGVVGGGGVADWGARSQLSTRSGRKTRTTLIRPLRGHLLPRGEKEDQNGTSASNTCGASPSRRLISRVWAWSMRRQPGGARRRGGRR